MTMTQNEIRRSWLREEKDYENAQSESDEEIKRDLDFTRQALEKGYLPDGFKEDLLKYEEILELVLFDRGIENTLNGSEPGNSINNVKKIR